MRIVSALLAVVLLLVASPVAAQEASGFSLRPAVPDPANPASQSYFIQTVAAGSSRADELLVLNSSDRSMTLDLYVVDAQTGATTGAVYANQGSAPTGPGRWVRLPQAQVAVPARSTARLPFDVLVPQGTPPGQYLAGIAAQPAQSGSAPSAATKVGAGQFSVSTTTRVVVAVAVTVPGALTRTLAVTGVRSVAGSTGSQLAVAVRNDGNVLLKPRGQLVLRDRGGAERARVPLAMDTILPGSGADMPVPWPADLPPGDYSAEVALDTTDSLALPASDAAPAATTHAEFRSEPFVVRPAIPSAGQSGAAQGSVVQAGAPATQVSGGQGGAVQPVGSAQGVETSSPGWLAFAIGGLALLVALNVGLVVYLLRSRRATAASRSAETIAPASPRPTTLGRPPERSVETSRFVKGRGRTLYLVVDGKRRPFASWAAFLAHGGSPTLSNVRLLREPELEAMPEGPLVEDAQSA